MRKTFLFHNFSFILFTYDVPFPFKSFQFMFTYKIESPLHKACNNKNLSIVKLLVNNGADIEAKDNIPFIVFKFL